MRIQMRVKDLKKALYLVFATTNNAARSIVFGRHSQALCLLSSFQIFSEPKLIVYIGMLI